MIGRTIRKLQPKSQIRNSFNKIDKTKFDYCFFKNNRIDINTKDEFGDNMLSQIFREIKHENQIVKVTDFLIRLGINLQNVNNRGESVLMLATNYRNYKLINLLIDSGAAEGIQKNEIENIRSRLNAESNQLISKIEEISRSKHNEINRNTLINLP